jgi:hypothetical protein
MTSANTTRRFIDLGDARLFVDVRAGSTPALVFLCIGCNVRDGFTVRAAVEAPALVGSCDTACRIC